MGLASTWCSDVDTLQAAIGAIRILQDGAEDRDTSGDLHYAVAKITLDPDHVKARSFAVDVGNGTTVRLEEATGVRRVWKDGRVVESNEKCTVEAGGARERRQQ